MFEDLPAVFLIGRDLEASKKFYSDTLGLEETSAAADHIRYRVGSVSLVVHAPISDEEMRDWNLEPLTEPRGSGVVITLQPKNVDEAYRHLLDKGADILFPPRNAPWGVRLFMLRDPNGFLIEVSRAV